VADRVTFTGQVSQEEKIRYLNQLWLAVNPSPKEGWGLTVIEANACGIPVVAADVPGLRDSVVHDQTGLLYPYGDIPAMSASIQELLSNSARCRRLSEHAVAWAGQFTWERSAQKAVEIIDRVVTQ
jgi:glycosyltransferase involved in cell wall biosynthesis